MLSIEGLRERMWGRFPGLRKALEGKPEPSKLFPLRSTDDTVFEAVQRLVKIATLACEWEEEVLATAQSIGPEIIDKDLDLLQQELDGVQRQIAAGCLRDVDRIGKLRAKLKAQTQ